MSIQSERLYQLRKSKKKLTQAKVAKYVGCDVKTYRSWESGKTPLSDVRFAESLANLYHESLDFVVGRRDKIELSEDAIRALTIQKGRSMKLLSRMLESPAFWDLLELMTCDRRGRINGNAEDL